MSALAEIRSSAEFYRKQVVASKKRLDDALEKHQRERVSLEERLAKDEAIARDFQVVADAAEAALATSEQARTEEGSK